MSTNNLSPPGTEIRALPTEIAESIAMWWPEWCEQNELPTEDAEQLEVACGLSLFVSQICQRHPELVCNLAEAGRLQNPLDAQTIESLAETLLGQSESTEALHTGLRQLRRAVAFVLAVRDLVGLASLEEVTQGMSGLAELATDTALEYLWQVQCEELGTPLCSSGEPMKMFVLGMGKLGGRELNFSSDIDLIFAYPEDGEVSLDSSDDKKDAALAHQTFFESLSQSLITTLHKITSDGQVFRVDMRLRPYGGSGPIILSSDATIRYYTARGRDWERYALIKARPIAGDMQAAEDLLKELRPFVYRRYVDFGAINEIRRMKEMISEQLVRKGKSFNVKLGRGGIREIEFFVQAFQIVYAGRDAALRTPFLSEGFAMLKRRQLVPGKDLDNLENAYVFLRRLEHRLQIYRDEQTHNLPQKKDVQLIVAVAMGFADYQSLLDQLEQVTDSVQQYFDDLFGDEGPTETERLDWMRLWEFEGGDSDEASEAFEFLLEHGFEDKDRAYAFIHGFREGRCYRALTGEAQARVDRLMPNALREVAFTSDPETTLRRFIGLLERIAARSAYVALLSENPDALNQLVKLIAQSEWAASWIRNYPAILDSLLVPLEETDLQDQEYLAARFGRAIELLENDDLEPALDALREVHHSRTLRIAAGFLSGELDASTAGYALSLLADAALSVALTMAQLQLRDDLGSVVAPGEGLPLAVLAYGKLGSRELGYGSDLDIVLIYDDTRVLANSEGGEKTVPAEMYFARLCQKLVFLLTTTTSAGKLYEIDMRLRPSGQSGLLVTSVKSFRKYQLERAQLWEHHALTRTRIAVGDSALGQKIRDIRQQALMSPRTRQEVMEHMVNMRQRMRKEHDKSSDDLFDLKQGVGGLVDIEFFAQAIVLVFAKDYPELLEEHTTPGLLLAAAGCGVLDPTLAQALGDIYCEYLSFDHGYKLANKPVHVPSEQVQNSRNAVESAWKTFLKDES